MPLGLTLPPSPSPRNNITSPQPVVEQFQANFPTIPQVGGTVVSAATAVAAVATASPAQTQATATSAAVSGTVAAPEVLNKLFESTVYPDPFSEQSPVPLADAANEQQVLDAPAAVCPALSAEPESIVAGAAIATAATGTPTKSMLSPPPTAAAGHRRNVSDTSAFNK